MAASLAVLAGQRCSLSWRTEGNHVGTLKPQGTVQMRQQSRAAAAATWSATLVAAAGSLRGTWRRQRRRRTLLRFAPSQVQQSDAVRESWLEAVDVPAFAQEVRQLGERLRAQQGEADLAHLSKLLSWSSACAAVGLLTMWTSPNLLTIAALSLWNWGAFFTTHFVSHGGYNRLDASGRYHSRRFAQGTQWQRLVDWFDWVLPSAWHIHHNRRHHYKVNEAEDPDFLERNFEGSGLMRTLKPFLAAPFWKWAWLSPNAYKELKVVEMKREKLDFADGFDPTAPFTIPKLVADSLNGRGDAGVVGARDLFLEVLGPYLVFRFLLLPLPLAFVDGSYFFNAFWNLLLAEIATNVHSYFVVMPNHTGSDLYRFERSCRPMSPTFYLRSVISSANYVVGDDVSDFMHGWLNYQIEHHCWPDLSMLSYRKGQPELRKICEKHGVPYTQQDLLTRWSKTLEVVTGRAQNRSFPVHLERLEDLLKA